MGLTRRQQNFVMHYLDCWNASEAARRAGYTGDADTIGPRLLGHVGVATEIAAGIAARGVTVPEVLQRLTDIARGDIGDFLTVDAAGAVKIDLTKHPDKLRLIKAVRQNGAAIEMYDAQAALVALGKALGLLRENLNVQREEPLEITTRVVYKREEKDGSSKSAHE